VTGLPPSRRRPRAALQALVAMTADLRIVRTAALDVAFEDRGPRGGFPVLLAHGWPDSVRTWDAVAPRLHAAGFRTIAYYLRGFGPTRFRQPSTLYSGQDAALASDLLQLATALELDRFAVVGHGWGARAGYRAAALEPRRVTQLVALSADYEADTPEDLLPLRDLRAHWHRWFFALPSAKDLLNERRAELAEYLWRSWSPGWAFSPRDLSEAALAFENPTFAEVTLHAHRHRSGLAPGDPSYAALEAQLAILPRIDVPTLTLHGAMDGAADPTRRAPWAQLFSGTYQRMVLPRVGHFPQRETPARVATEITSWLTTTGDPAPTLH
jgi:pimeloyl-ACP methyl ester carboxylesterase